MPKSKKKKKIKPAILKDDQSKVDTKPGIRPSAKKKKNKKKKNKKKKDNKDLPKILPKKKKKKNKKNKTKKKKDNKKSKKKKKRAKTKIDIDLSEKKKKKQKKDKQNARKRAQTTINKSNKSDKSDKSDKNTSSDNIKPIKFKKKNKKLNKNSLFKKKDNKTMQLNTISFAPAIIDKNDDEKKESKSKSKSKPGKLNQKRFPWSKWAIDLDNDDNDNDNNTGHRQRRSSLGSIRELHHARIQQNNQTVIIKDADLNTINGSGSVADDDDDDDDDDWGSLHNRHNSSSSHTSSHSTHSAHSGHRKKRKKKSLKNKNSSKKHSGHKKKEKKRYKFKIIPKHQVKRSSLPTYNSIRKNNPKLTHYVKKESTRDLAQLLDQPEKRTKSKHLKNLSRNGFVLHVNRRYRLYDGRVGICKFKGRTQFGKSSEDWIGLVIEIGCGEHDGSVQGKVYFRCRDGKGVLVRPYDIIQDMGSKNKLLSQQDKKLAAQHIKRYKMNDGILTTSSTRITDDDKAINSDHSGSMYSDKFYNPKTLIDKNKGKKADKKRRYFQI